MASRRLTASDVLRFNIERRHRATVRRFYDEWRRENRIPARCDNNSCVFYGETPHWNGSPLSLILDHINGNSLDNRPENLRLLCPNCDSQLPTRGGKNKGRIRNLSEQGFAVQHRDGRRDALVVLTGNSITAQQGTLNPDKTEDESNP